MLKVLKNLGFAEVYSIKGMKFYHTNITYFPSELAIPEHHTKCDKLELEISTTMIYNSFFLYFNTFYIVMSKFEDLEKYTGPGGWEINISGSE